MLFSQTFGVLGTLILAIIWPRWGIVERVLFFAGLSFLWLVAYPIGYRWEIKRNARKTYAGSQGKGILGEHTILIDPEGVTERSVVGESRTAWSGVERVDDDNQNIYLFVGPVQAHVIPKRAFENSDDADAFLQMAQAYRLARVQQDR